MDIHVVQASRYGTQVAELEYFGTEIERKRVREAWRGFIFQFRGQSNCMQVLNAYWDAYCSWTRGES